ncbi:hypothetical protein QYE76_034179 [Lolium multiflorum]|uniref:CCHC-type domain-containing protein n=1 Tax=Lolium multiflorum TaxID=4521 RepID=A0AAD8VMT2_LOLMU|nr:hypothetical protein QYE76_034178 [Lolium multiflorum]KAK1610506.1 hypothetical protein QYE76_034179 [Lolium multiflorum]
MADKGTGAEHVPAAEANGSRDLVVATDDLAKGGSSETGSSSKTAGGGETVVEMMQRLNLTSKEADPLVLEDEGDDDLPCPEWALVGKVLAPNTLHINTIRTVVRSAWGNPKDLVVNPLGPNLFLAEFGSEADRSRVAKGGAWKLSNHAILLKNFDVSVQPEDVVFDELLVWARIMNLSFDMMNSERGTPLASRLGRVDHLDVDDKGRAWGSYLRVRVTINPLEPIMRCISVFSKRRNMTMQFNVMYERLPIFCFSCGLLGHSSLVCPTPAVRDSEGKLPYHGEKLCVPEKRKENVSSMGHSQSNKPSWDGTKMGPGSQASGSMPGDKQQEAASGEVTSPTKNPRQHRASVTRVNPAAKKVISPSKPAKKRKQKQEYRPKLPVLHDGALITVPVGVAPPIAPNEEGRTDRFEAVVDDSNKKQRTNTRSADPAAAAMQPRQSQ